MNCIRALIQLARRIGQKVEKWKKSLNFAIGLGPAIIVGTLLPYCTIMGGAADLSTANLAQVAVAVTNQSWDKLGLDHCDDAAAGTTVDTAATLQLRATAIIMMRLAAITAPPNAYANLATGTIGKTILADFMEETTPTNNALSSGCTGESSLSSLPLASNGGKSAVDNHNKNKKKKYSWPGMVNGQVIVQQVYNFVGRMFQGYKQVPYHNQEHAFHVLQSITKLIDLLITGGGKTYGLKYDPLALFALVFAALIHDVGTCCNDYYFFFRPLTNVANGYAAATAAAPSAVVAFFLVITLQSIKGFRYVYCYDQYFQCNVVFLANPVKLALTA
jgi:hypothetical protein